MAGVWLDARNCKCPPTTIARSGTHVVDGVAYCLYCRARSSSQAPVTALAQGGSRASAIGRTEGDVVICGRCQAQTTLHSSARGWSCFNCSTKSFILTCPNCAISQSRTATSSHSTGRAAWTCHACQTNVALTPAKKTPRFGTAEALRRSQQWLGADGGNARLISDSSPYEIRGMTLVPNVRTWIGVSDDAVTFTQGWGGGVADQVRLSIRDISSITVGGAGSYVTSQPGGVFAIGSGLEGMAEAIAISAIANSVIGMASTQHHHETLITIASSDRYVALVNRSVEPVALTTWFTPLQRATSEVGKSTPRLASQDAFHHVQRFEAIRLLRDSGAISEAEYDLKRAELLGDI